MTNKMNELLEVIESSDYLARNGRNVMRQCIVALNESGRLDVAVEKTFDSLASSDLENSPASTIAARLAASFVGSAGIPRPGQKGMITLGIEILDWYAKIRMIKAIKKDVIKKRKGKKTVMKVWYLEAVDDFQELTDSKIFCDPRAPYLPWILPTRYESGSQIPIVKKADRYGLLKKYRVEDIPKIYQVLNRIGMTTWQINMDLFEYMSQLDESNSPLKPLATDEERAKAMALMRRVKVKPSRMKEAKNLIRAHDQRMDFEKILTYAEMYQEQDLHFTYNLCGRGRIYALSPFLNPQGADAAKALLELKDKTPIVQREFFIHLANCAGEDKSTYDEREQWVVDNYDTLVAIGKDPIGQWEAIKEMGVNKEKKTFYQFIACTMDLAKWDADPTHKTGILLGLDSTSSGNQILAMVSRDHEVAQHVNISRTPDGRPGDLYRHVGLSVKSNLEALDFSTISEKLAVYVREEPINALAALPKGHKTFRKITKRPCMVLPYSGTRYGAGEITQDDQYDHGSPEMDNLNFAECSIVGGVIYDSCEQAAKRSMDIMKLLRDSVKNIPNLQPLITWTVPHTNFTAFQYKEKTREDGVTGEIGGKSVSLRFNSNILDENGNKIGDKEKHQDKISPAIVHSLDAAMMSMIILGIPNGVPVAAIHDQFCVPFGNMESLVKSARTSYAAIADRELFLELCQSAFGNEVKLPKPGNWEVSDLEKTDYFIC